MRTPLAHPSRRSRAFADRASVRRTLTGLSGLTLASPSYLLVLLAAAARERLAPREHGRDGRQLHLCVLVPAHDEEVTISRLLSSLAATDYPQDRLEVTVVADNCSDATAEVARRAGAVVTERVDPQRRGKGYALAHGIEAIRAGVRPDAIVLVDADCEVTENFPSAIARAFAEGATVVQTDNEASGPVQQSATGLASVGMVLINRIRPQGKSRLGISAGLLGTGMAFTMDAVDAIGWARPTLAEDIEQHVQLVLAGHRVTYVGDACVTSALATTAGGWRDQQARWEAGRWQAARRYAPRLIIDGLRSHRLQPILVGLDLTVPPQSVITALSAATGIAGVVAGHRGARRAAALALMSQATFVIGGLLVAGAPLRTFTALRHAPTLIVRKLALYASLGRGRSPTEWVRGERPTEPSA